MASRSEWGLLSGGLMYDLPRWWLPVLRIALYVPIHLVSLFIARLH